MRREYDDLKNDERLCRAAAAAARDGETRALTRAREMEARTRAMEDHARAIEDAAAALREGMREAATRAAEEDAAYPP